MNADPSDTRADGNAAAEPAAAVESVTAVESPETVVSVAAVVDDIEAYLQRWLTRINRVLGHAHNLAYREDQVCRRENEIAQREIDDARREQDLAVREHELQFRERQLAETTDEFRGLRERWVIQRDAEIEKMQQQVVELTEAWLRLEHEQRSSALPSPGRRDPATRDAACDSADPSSGGSRYPGNKPGHDDADDGTGVPGPTSAPGPASVPGPANVSVLGGGSGPRPAVSGPATRTSRAVSDVTPSGDEGSASNAGRPSFPSPAPIPASLKGRHASTSSDQPAQSDNGRPTTISPADPAEPPPPRESSFQQFQQLQRELGRSSQTNR